jgi:hypothetical protein
MVISSHKSSKEIWTGSFSLAFLVPFLLRPLELTQNRDGLKISVVILLLLQFLFLPQQPLILLFLAFWFSSAHFYKSFSFHSVSSIGSTHLFLQLVVSSHWYFVDFFRNSCCNYGLLVWGMSKNRFIFCSNATSNCRLYSLKCLYKAQYRKFLITFESLNTIGLCQIYFLAVIFGVQCWLNRLQFFFILLKL